MSMGNSGLTLRTYVPSVCFYFACLCDKHHREGVLRLAHFTQLSVVPGPVRPGLVWKCLSYRSTNFHRGAGRSDGFKWLEGAVKTSGHQLGPTARISGITEHFCF